MVSSAFLVGLGVVLVGMALAAFWLGGWFVGIPSAALGLWLVLSSLLRPRGLQELTVGDSRVCHVDHAVVRRRRCMSVDEIMWMFVDTSDAPALWVVGDRRSIRCSTADASWMCNRLLSVLVERMKGSPYR